MENQGKIKVRCPYCQQKLKMDDYIREVTCPKCNGQFAIEEENGPSPEPEIQPEIKSVITLTQDEKTCPLCSGIVKREAIFCRHCQNNIQKIREIACKCPTCAEVFVTAENNANKAMPCPICDQPVIVRSNHPLLRKKSKPQGTAAARSTSSKPEPVEKNICRKPEPARQKSLASLILGIIGCTVPLIGLPVAIIGLILGYKAKYSLGIFLNIISLVISLIGLFLIIFITILAQQSGNVY